MPDKDIVLAKVASIQKCLRRIRDITGLKPDALDDIDKQDIFVLNLQRSVQSAIDLATHIVASEGMGVPETIKDSFARLADAGIIGKILSHKMQSMAGFRNIAVHDYQAINPDILKAILTKHLPDIEEFYTAVIEYFHYVEKQE